MSILVEEAIAAISAQQPAVRSAVWMVGEQLKDMCREDEHTAQIVLTDLRNNPKARRAWEERA